MTLDSENITCMRIFSGWGRQTTVGLLTTAIFGYLGGKW